MPEEKRKLNAWIPVSLYSKLESAGYDNITQALIKALEKFFEDTQEDITGYAQDIEGYKQDIEALAAENTQLKESIAGYQKDIEGSKKDLERIHEGHEQDVTGYKENIKALNSEIERLKNVILEAPDPLDLARMQARSEELEKHNLTLKGEMEKAHQDKDDIKNLYDNYMRQMQTLINQKAIETPKDKRKPFWKIW